VLNRCNDDGVVVVGSVVGASDRRDASDAHDANEG
jgi:hypothetical protein